jgi:hypothetical protein
MPKPDFSCIPEDNKPANFSSPVCSRSEEAGKNSGAGFMRWSPICQYTVENYGWQRVKF